MHTELKKGQEIIIYFSLIEKYQTPVYSNAMNKKIKKLIKNIDLKLKIKIEKKI